MTNSAPASRCRPTARLAVGANEESSAADRHRRAHQADKHRRLPPARSMCVRAAVRPGVSRASIKESNTGAGDDFGTSVALSADGATLAVGAAEESSAATGIGGGGGEAGKPGDNFRRCRPARGSR